jgi:hypothetical protein
MKVHLYPGPRPPRPRPSSSRPGRKTTVQSA